MTVATDIVSVVTSGGALVIALWGARTAREALNENRRANQIAEAALRRERELDRAAREVAVEFRFRHEARSDRASAYVINLDDPRPEPLEYVIAVEIINGGEAPIFLAGATVIGPAVTEELILRNQDDIELAPRSRAPFDHYVAAADLEEGAWTVEARLATGLTIPSDPQPLDRQLIDSILSHNQRARPR